MNVEHRISALEQFRRMGPTKFKGSSDPSKAKVWQMQLKKILDVIDYTKVLKVSFAIFMLKRETEH